MKRLLAKIYAYTFLSDFVLIYPLYAVMFSDFGMEPWQIATLLAIWSTTAFLLEVPSGILADKYSRKHILFAGQCIRTFAFITWILFPNFAGFLVGFVLWGIESALSSGTYQALLYDELQELKEERQFTKIYGRARTVSFIAILSASVLASPAILLGYPFILILSSIAVFLAGLIIIFLPKARKSESTREKEYFSILKRGLKGVFENAVVFKLLFFTSLAFAFGSALEEFYSLFADSAGLPVYGIGIFIALVTGMEGFASFAAYRFEKLKAAWFYLLFILSGLLLLLAGYLFTVPALLLIILFALPSGIIQTVFEGKLQHAIPSGVRATISSVKGFFTETKTLAIYFAVGFIAQVGDYRDSFIVFGIIMMLVGLFYLLFTEKRNPNSLFGVRGSVLPKNGS